MTRNEFSMVRAFAFLTLFAIRMAAQEVLPFPSTPSASVAGRTLQDSVHKWRIEPNRLPANAPNILIILLDDTGPGLPSTYGGEIHTPTLDRIAKMGISYNSFHVGLGSGRFGITHRSNQRYSE
jgi:arylsulfatase